MRTRTLTTLAMLLVWLGAANALWGQVAPGVAVEQATAESILVDAARRVLTEMMAAPATGIPHALLAKSEAIAIVPGMVKGGFIIGARHGRGVVVMRDEQRNWTLPTFIAMTGGSVGWQVGLQETDVILVFKTRKSVQGLLRGKFTIGADVSVAAGPVGREAAAATDAALRAEIYSYSRTRGLFAGVALDGSALTIDAAAGTRYYGAGAVAGQAQPVPPSAVRLLDTVAIYTAADDKAEAQPGQQPAAVPPPQPVPNPGARPEGEPDAVRTQLAASAQRLAARLDQTWQRYLALPAEVYSGERAVPIAALNDAVGRYRRVAADARYANLTSLAEFQQTHSLLERYVRLRTAARQPVVLPPPPK